tara:strand:+ start:861 stop:1001 length:141 start_codon:yes stop_codon:yes gene_type:complete
MAPKYPSGPVKPHKSMATGDSYDEAASKAYDGKKPSPPKNVAKGAK